MASLISFTRVSCGAWEDGLPVTARPYGSAPDGWHSGHARRPQRLWAPASTHRHEPRSAPLSGRRDSGAVEADRRAGGLHSRGETGRGMEEHVVAPVQLRDGGIG